MLDREAVDALGRRGRRARAPRVHHPGRPRGDAPDQPRRARATCSRGRASTSSRLVYTSSVAAYGFHADNPQPLTEDVPPRGSERFYYSAQKAELEAALRRGDRRPESRPTSCARASSPGPDAQMLLRELPRAQAAAAVPLLPDPGTPFHPCKRGSPLLQKECYVEGREVVRGDSGPSARVGDGARARRQHARGLGRPAEAVTRTDHLAPMTPLACVGFVAAAAGVWALPERRRAAVLAASVAAAAGFARLLDIVLADGRTLNRLWSTTTWRSRRFTAVALVLLGGAIGSTAAAGRSPAGWRYAAGALGDAAVDRLRPRRAATSTARRARSRCHWQAALCTVLVALAIGCGRTRPGRSSPTR